MLANGAAGAVADEEQVLRIGRAVVENALVHTPSGTSVRITAHADGGRAALEIADDGPGMPAEQRRTCSSASTASTAAGPPAAASGLRSRTSWRS